VAQPRPLAFQFNRGMRQDEPREQMVAGAAWNLVDYLPQFGGPLAKRGGWEYASPDLATVHPSASYVQAVAHAPFEAGAKLCALDEDGELYTVASPSSASHIGAAVAPLQVPVFHRNRLIIPAGDGVSTPKSYDGSTLTTLGGSPPAAQYAAVYKDRTLLGNTNAEPQRLSFSGPGDPQSWPAAGYIDVSAPIRAIAALRSAVLVWSDGRTERIRGATPPPNTDMVLEPLFDQGCLDARSVASYGDFVIWANQTGVFLTDAATIIDLTEAGGMSHYWQTLLSGYTSSWTLSAGVYRGYYVLSIADGPSFKDCLVCDLDRRVWFRLANIRALTFAPAVGAAAELYFGDRASARVCSFSSVFSPAAGVKEDADGSAVTPIMETPFTPVQGLLRVRYAYLGYELADAAADRPTLSIGYLTSPAGAAYTTLDDTFGATTGYKRARAAVRQRAGGFGFKVTQSGPSATTLLYGVELEGHDLEKSRRA